ncbi:hypothetical protein BIW11_09396 [Tropilaelaps mercedesae]|uniref:Band 4.1 domain-containing protein n=1 Tax=Tropilaelaps mercedesae TaxID=418985 RepID=A0A1V9XKC7_9ACAR|nr:hypothetical protein BIW11_09396 [Tropilaelaps mercedesae]
MKVETQRLPRQTPFASSSLIGYGVQRAAVATASWDGGSRRGRRCKASGQVLFDQVCRVLNLLESDYFGLEYCDDQGTRGDEPGEAQARAGGEASACWELDEKEPDEEEGEKNGTYIVGTHRAIALQRGVGGIAAAFSHRDQYDGNCNTSAADGKKPCLLGLCRASVTKIAMNALSVAGTADGYITWVSLRCYVLLQYWLDYEKAMCNQLCLNLEDAFLEFCVKFYTPDPGQLEEEFTRYLFSLQIKRDLSQGTLLVHEDTAAVLASYIVQGSFPSIGWQRDVPARLGDSWRPIFFSTFSELKNLILFLSQSTRNREVGCIAYTIYPYDIREVFFKLARCGTAIGIVASEARALSNLVLCKRVGAKPQPKRGLWLADECPATRRSVRRAQSRCAASTRCLDRPRARRSQMKPFSGRSGWPLTVGLSCPGSGARAEERRTRARGARRGCHGEHASSTPEAGFPDAGLQGSPQPQPHTDSAL